MKEVKKMYERPAMKVRTMRQRTQLLAGSKANATMNGTFEEEDW